MKKVLEEHVTTELKVADVHVCPWHNCNDCWYFDSSYHGGYCDKHKVDTSPGKSCGDWASK